MTQSIDIWALPVGVGVSVSHAEGYSIRIVQYRK